MMPEARGESSAVELERDLQAFRTALPELIKAAMIDSVWPTFDDALGAGYARFGTDRFLVQEITDIEKPKYFSRNVAPCPS
jgi:hypothetical protein